MSDIQRNRSMQLAGFCCTSGAVCIAIGLATQGSFPALLIPLFQILSPCATPSEACIITGSSAIVMSATGLFARHIYARYSLDESNRDLNPVLIQTAQSML